VSDRIIMLEFSGNDLIGVNYMQGIDFDTFIAEGWDVRADNLTIFCREYVQMQLGHELNFVTEVSEVRLFEIIDEAIWMHVNIEYDGFKM